MAKNLAISAAVSAAIVALAYVVVMTVHTPLSQLFLFTGYRVGEALVPLIPETASRWLGSQQGGPLVAASALVTWFLVVWAVCFYPVLRMRSNSALLTDTYSSPLRAPRGAAKRER